MVPECANTSITELHTLSLHRQYGSICRQTKKRMKTYAYIEQACIKGSEFRGMAGVGTRHPPQRPIHVITVCPDISKTQYKGFDSPFCKRGDNIA